MFYTDVGEISHGAEKVGPRSIDLSDRPLGHTLTTDDEWVEEVWMLEVMERRVSDRPVCTIIQHKFQLTVMVAYECLPD